MSVPQHDDYAVPWALLDVAVEAKPEESPEPSDQPTTREAPAAPDKPGYDDDLPSEYFVA